MSNNNFLDPNNLGGGGSNISLGGNELFSR